MPASGLRVRLQDHDLEVTVPSSRIERQSGSFLMPSLDHATVSDAMHPGILRCEPGLSVTEVARMMSTHHVHCVVVMGIVHDQPLESLGWGIISDLDLVRAGIRGGAEPTAREVAQQPVITAEPTMPLREAGELMLAEGVSHLVVVQPGSRRPIGILSTLDIAGVFAWGEA
jgi:CBS domain-containing protein